MAVTRSWNPKARLWLQGRQNIFEHIRLTLSNDPGGQVVWIHCASLGEFEQGRPLLERLKRERPSVRLILTFFSPSGYEAARNYKGADHIFYLPADSPANAERFLDLTRPSLVLWVKYEYWYYYLSAIHTRKIPLLLVSAIFLPEQLFFKWYGGLYRKLLGFFSQLFVQTEESRILLEKIGFTANVHVSGDTRFDRVTDIAGRFEPIPAIEQFCAGKEVIVAGSTWKEDEEILNHFANTHPELRMIIAPHEITPSHLQEITQWFTHAVLYSSLAKQQQPGSAPFTPGKPANVLIIDNIGMLSRLYRYATIAYVGGGFSSTGVHNVLEAAVYGKPVVFGPVYNRFVEAQELVAKGGAFSIDNALALETVFNTLLQRTGQYQEASAAAGQYVSSRKGATAYITEYVLQHALPGSTG